MSDRPVDEREDMRIQTRLGRCLASGDPIVRTRAAEALGRMSAGTGMTSVPHLARISLDDDNSGVRAAAVNALIRLDVPVADIRTNALELLSHPAREVRARAGWTMGRFEPAEVEPAVPALVECLRTDPDVDPKFGALWAFARSRLHSPEILAVLEHALRDASGDVRSEAARTLGRIGPKAAAVEPTLADVLDDVDPLARGNAAEAIGLIGTAAPVTVARLRARCSDPIDYVRGAAVTALARLREAVPDRTETAEEDPWLEDAPSVDVLLGRLQGDDAFLRAEAAWLLAKRGVRDVEVSDALATQAIVDPDSDARWAALYALARIGVPGSELTGTLTNILASDVDPDVRQGAAAALAVQWQGAPGAAVGSLAVALDDEDPMVRDEAADALRAIGPPASEARAALGRAAEDAHSGVRARAREALATIASE